MFEWILDKQPEMKPPVAVVYTLVYGVVVPASHSSMVCVPG